MTKIIGLFFAAFVMMSCASKNINPKYSTEEVKQFKNISVVEPVVEVYEISGDGKKRIKDHDRKIQDDFISSLGDFLIRTNSAYYKSSDIGLAQSESLKVAFDSGLFYRDAVQISDIPKNLLSIGTEDKVLFLYMYGYYKTRPQRIKEFWKSVGIGVATLGLYVPIYQGKYIGIHSIMINKKEREIIYRDYVASGEDFRENQQIRRLLDKSVGRYFAKKDIGINP